MNDLPRRKTEMNKKKKGKMSLNKKEGKRKEKKSRETKREKGKEINYASFLFGLINDHESETTRVRRWAFMDS